MPLDDQGPLYHLVADGPQNGRATWVRTSDELRIRVAHWGVQNSYGTVFLFPGRTEYIEKYGRTAGIFCDLGFDTLAIDWRGQGLSDRLINDPMVGHVNDFLEYQSDLDALITFAETETMPKPWYIMAHSMGGAIALRALHRDLDFNAAAFTGPMWGILVPAILAPFRNIIAKIGIHFGFGERYPPTTSDQSYTFISEFQDNTLTPDPDMWAYMKRQVTKHPDLQLAGPSFIWADAAFREIEALHRMSPPKIPALCFLGDEECIIDPQKVRKLIKGWTTARLINVPYAKHEILMLDYHRQKILLRDICDFLKKQHVRQARYRH